MTWANSPNSMGEVGEDGQGYNAGIVHFFEYRGNKQKASRFKVIEEPPTVDGFIEYSAKIKHDLDYIGNNPDNDEAVLEDEEGNKRIYILRPNGDLIVAFQYAGQSEPHATTVLVRQKPKDFEKNVAASESGNDKGKLNRLGTNVHRLL